MTTARFTVNGQPVSVEVENRRLLVEVLRDDLKLTGTHVGCDTSNCGACSIMIDGESAKSCTVLAVQADGSSITTIEGLSGPYNGMSAVQEGFRQCHGRYRLVSQSGPVSPLSCRLCLLHPPHLQAQQLTRSKGCRCE